MEEQEADAARAVLVAARRACLALASFSFLKHHFSFCVFTNELQPFDNISCKMRGALKKTRKNARKPPGNQPGLAGKLLFLGLWCSGEPNEKKKTPKILFLTYLKIPGKYRLVSLRYKFPLSGSRKRPNKNFAGVGGGHIRPGDKILQARLAKKLTLDHLT